MKRIYVGLGTITLVLGVVGIFVPLLPTTPFLLLSAWLYCKGSPRLYGWLMGHPALGTYIRNYRDKHAVTLRTKIISLSLLWGTILFCIFFVVDHLWLQILLGVILVCVSWHLASFRTIRQIDNITFRKVNNSSTTYRLLVLLESAAHELGGRGIVAGVSVDSVSFLLRAGGVNAGYVVVSGVDNILTIDQLYILPEYRGRGFGRDVIVFLDYYCSYRGFCRLQSCVDVSNEQAARFFSKHGFSSMKCGDDDLHEGSVFFFERYVGNEQKDDYTRAA